ncbi:FAD-dependent oxidoreductase [Nocardia shimofusensis]|uniref:FAD-dependent oxidoreductase n=1 Tax=Nocardia shimofusensis TaxID=228596 RepID=UPI00082F15F0|nr:FAD-dependent oxidoreductase [Nocardia shimofusensis]
MTSIWSTADDTVTRPPLPPGQRHDVVVVGAGLTGLVTALLLAEAGRDVVVVEGRRIGVGTTGLSTGKVSLLQSTRAGRIAEHCSLDALRTYLDANRAGQRWLLDYCASHAVDVQHRAAITYAQTAAAGDDIRAEHEITRAAGLPTEYVHELDTPFPSFGGVRLPDQAQLDPMAVLLALAADLDARSIPIYESTRVQGVGWEPRGDHLVRTDQADLRAGTVILATGAPILDRGGFFARLTAQRSYLSAFRVGEPIPGEMFISADSPTRSLRTVPAEDGELLLVGGNGHEVGRAENTTELVEDLVDWTQRVLPTAEPIAHWSAQDYTPVGELPYAGPLLPGSDRILIATGYAKWGLTNGVAAALALAGHITGATPAWAPVFTTWRPPALHAITSTASANTAVLQYLTAGWLSGMRGDEPDDRPAEGCGRVRRQGLRPVATATVDGVTTSVSAVCPHLYGVVRWNSAEKSWDCPLHGSRFAADGSVLEGPATRSLMP